MVEDLADRPVVGARAPVRLTLREALGLLEDLRADGLELAGDGVESRRAAVMIVSSQGR